MKRKISVERKRTCDICFVHIQDWEVAKMFKNLNLLICDMNCLFLFTLDEFWFNWLNRIKTPKMHGEQDDITEDIVVTNE